MNNKGGLDTYLLFTRKPVDYFPTAGELVAMKNSGNEEKYKELMNYKIDPLDLSDIPNFNYSAAGIGESVLQAYKEIIVLIFLNIIFFSTAWASFLRSDVR